MLEPAWYRIAYRRSDGVDDTDDACLQAVLTHEDGAITLQVTPQVDVTLSECEIGFRHAFASHEQVLMNGYQSWTDTVERPASDTMRGLVRVPRHIVNRYVLDGMGDYRFVEYPQEPGCQHGFTFARFRQGAHCSLLASLDESDGFTLICSDQRHGRVTAQKECPQHPIKAGQAVTLCRLLLAEGSSDGVFGYWFDRMGISALPAQPLVGYTSWYRHYQDIDAGKLENDLRGAAASFSSVDCIGFQKVFQIDDGYTAVGDWLDVDSAAFPRGMSPLSRSIADEGFLPGIWLAPFVCERKSQLFRKHSDWLLRDAGGKLVRTGCHWSGGYALDTRNEQVRAYVTHVVRTMTQEWGFGLLKLDFLYAACMLPHDGMTRGQLMADAVDLLRAAAGPHVLLLGCGVPLASVFGKMEYCRIGCDVGPDWDDTPPMRLLHRERVSTKRSCANTLGRAALHGRAFCNDPDVFFLRDDVKLSRIQRSEVLSLDARMAGVLLTSDDMGTWGDVERSLFEAALTMMRQRISVRQGGRA